jgi:threonine/homoserine/homoserine lactone efflux protein
MCDLVRGQPSAGCYLPGMSASLVYLLPRQVLQDIDPTRPPPRRQGRRASSADRWPNHGTHGEAHIGDLVEPAALLPRVGKHLAQRRSEPQRAVPGGQDRGAHVRRAQWLSRRSLCSSPATPAARLIPAVRLIPAEQAVADDETRLRPLRGGVLTQRMMAHLLAFLIVSAVVICTPGPDTALTVRNALVGGRSGGIWTAAGVAAGQAVWTLAASVGAASLLHASEPAFLALKLFGAGYLVYLGIQSLRAAFSTRPHAAVNTRTAPSLTSVRAFRQGLLNDLGNPKMAAFFMSLLPQFVPTAKSGSAVMAFLLLGFLFCGLTFAWLAGYSAAISKARRLLSQPRMRRSIDGLAGCVLMGFGLRLAFANPSP